ncbi:MAG: VOC family protein [Cyanomargarita calcarea GSE-NOS-MK-12-04C]|jgi:4-hydroxyphenylpyruvate dioxygenase|uniref:VOC family protein n=1 Tax=Cyanomargarita calcarea GSE-NOS-MK-12-04C TaxID=2839659 RepID=A0A951QT33_9CYAN|nr:VOC family protein [Cyanomargarita calcarea GSE-NOS-MK-12-04C]
MRINHIHFYVEDAKQWRNWFIHHLGFEAVTFDYAIPLKESFHTCTEVVKSDSVCFLLSSPLLPTSPVAEYLRQHPPGVADVAFDVEDVEETLAQSQVYGVKVLQPIQQHQQGEESVKWSQIAAWGGLTHTLIETRKEEELDNLSFPYSSNITAIDHIVLNVPEGDLEQRKEEELDNLSFPYSSNITAIDHIVLNVPEGDLEHAVAWYKNILDFQPQQMFKIKTNRSALHSQVMVSPQGNVQLPINEPATPNSQIQEFINVNRGAGIQHIALRTPNIVEAIAKFRSSGLCFLRVPQSYYEILAIRQGLPLSPTELQAIAQQEILVDWQENTPEALLLQIFTQPIFGQPTFFFEFIERKNQAQGFGEGNFRALFEAIESEQLKRGSLN